MVNSFAVRRYQRYTSRYKMYLLTYVLRVDSDQPAHSCSLIRIFTWHILQGFFIGTTKITIRLHGWAGWFESSAYVKRYIFLHCGLYYITQGFAHSAKYSILFHFRDCKIIRDPQSLKSKGYGFVSFVNKVVSFFLPVPAIIMAHIYHLHYLCPMPPASKKL